MKNAKRTIMVPVVFAGHVAVSVPAKATDAQGEALARKLAVARLLATTDNPDSGTAEDDACQEFAEKHGLSETMAEKLWDASECVVEGGIWTTL